MSGFPMKLAGLADKRAYPELGELTARWGQLLRQDPDIHQAAR